MDKTVPETTRRLKAILSSVDAASPSTAVACSYLNSSFHSMNIFNAYESDFGKNIPVHRDLRQQISSFLQDQLNVALATDNQNAIVQIQETSKLVEHILSLIHI